MRTSESIAKLVEALAAAQGEFSNPERNRTVKVTTKAKEGRPPGQYTFDYATFDAILSMARPILAKHGLAVIQAVSTSENGSGTSVRVLTRLAHSSGEWLEDEIVGHADSGDLQSIGSACTYLKRYSYTALLNIAAEEDDDGVACSGHQAEKKDKAPRPACPKCGKVEFVLENRQGPGWFCWHNEEKKKFGCGHQWDDTPKATVLSQAEINYIGDATETINGVTSEDSLMAVCEIIKTKSESIRNALRPLAEAKLKVLRTSHATREPEATTA